MYNFVSNIQNISTFLGVHYGGMYGMETGEQILRGDTRLGEKETTTGMIVEWYIRSGCPGARLVIGM
jgi:hypothetical protein